MVDHGHPVGVEGIGFRGPRVPSVEQAERVGGGPRVGIGHERTLPPLPPCPGAEQNGERADEPRCQGLLGRRPQLRERGRDRVHGVRLVERDTEVGEALVGRPSRLAELRREVRWVAPEQERAGAGEGHLAYERLDAMPRDDEAPGSPIHQAESGLCGHYAFEPEGARRRRVGPLVLGLPIVCVSMPTASPRREVDQR